MAVEIERKFLVKNNSWRTRCSSEKKYIQGYIAGAGLASVRVRLENDEAFLNIKSLTLGIVRCEYEYRIPKNEAVEMLDKLCTKPLITKTRFIVMNNNNKWEIDEFEGDNNGLIVAEIELHSEDEQFELPDFIAEEVSNDVRYYNVNLVDKPYNQW